MIGGRENLTRIVQRLGKHTVNRLAVLILKSGIPFPMFTSHTAIVVETVGRKSGTRRATPMAFAKESATTLKVVAEHGLKSDWVRNALAAANVKVWWGGRRYLGTLQVLDEDPRVVWAQMRGRTHVAMAKALAFEPVVLRLELTPAEPVR